MSQLTLTTRRQSHGLRRPGGVVVAILVVALLLAAAWSLKGRGYLYALKLRLGLAEARPALTTDIQRTGSIPGVDRSGRVYPPVDPDLRFERVALPASAGNGYTCVAAGPDGALWAATDDGRILRFPISSGGMLGEPSTFGSLRNAWGGDRLLVGICFDPSAPPEAPVIWATHSQFAFHGADDWSGAITRLSGPQLDEVQDVVIGLPRSTGDHATNQSAFGPDGALYIPQASNTAYGAPDAVWGMRPERLLNASILRLDVDRLPAKLPLDVRTDEGGTYDPAAPDAPLTIHATGVRLAYDLCWTRDGRLWAPVNGSSPGGNAPASPDGSAPALEAIPMSEPDWLVRIIPGRYYGHPNPQQGHYVLNGGNPTPERDFAEIVQYPVGTLPDERWEAPAADLGAHQSADGLIEYRAAGSTAGERKLDGALVICRYSLGGDLIAVLLAPDGGVAEIVEGIPGFTGFANPLDVTQDPATGHLYVADYGERAIVLLRAVRPGL